MRKVNGRTGFTCGDGRGLGCFGPPAGRGSSGGAFSISGDVAMPMERTRQEVD